MYDIEKQWTVDLERAKKELPQISGWRYTKIKQFANTAYDRGLRRQAELFIINCWRAIKYKDYNRCDELIHNFYRYVLEDIL